MNLVLLLFPMSNSESVLPQSAIDGTPVQTSEPDSDDDIVDTEALPHLSTTNPGETNPESKFAQGFGKEFLTAFVAIFLAEIGDKTQLSTLLMAAESHSPWIVFTGAAAALMTTSLIGVLLGRWLATHLSPQTLKFATGVGMLLIAASLLWDVVELPVVL